MKLAAAMAVALMGMTADAAALERWGPTWSELTGARYSKATMHREPAIIKSVDGRNYTNRVARIDPGKHRVVVQSSYRKGSHSTDRVMTLVIAPCQRYYINAQFASSVGSEWAPVVAKTEHIAGCKIGAPRSPEPPE